MGDEIFAGASSPADIIKRTNDFLQRTEVTHIYFDLNRIKSASKTFRVPTDGYFAREELKLLFNPSLWNKTTLIKMGQEVTPSKEYLMFLLK